jgi:NitT/TauT family transport system substrate-binding protein
MGGALRAPRLGRRVRVVLAALAVAAASACGSSGSAAVAEGEPILVSVSIAAPSAAPVFLADTLNYFEEEGLNVEVREIANASLQVATGQVQFGQVNTNTLMQSASEDIGLQAVCVTQIDPSYVLAVSEDTWNRRGLTESMSLQEQLTALQGEQITAVGGRTVNPGAKLLGALLEKNGLPADWIGVLSMAGAAQSTAAFQNNQVGVIFQPQPQPDQVLSHVPGRILYSIGDSPLFAEMDNVAWSTIATSAEFAAANPDLTRRMCNAIGRANNYLDDNPEGAAEALQSVLPVDFEILKKALPTYKWARDASMSEADFFHGVEVLGEMGMFDQAASPESTQVAYTGGYQN